MTIEFRDAKRAGTRLLILLAGGTGAGKTESAMRLATGLADGKPFAVIDTENGRALHKADDYDFKHAELDAPFTPERYAEAVLTAAECGFPVIVIDSGSHEYEGVGGVLDIQEAEFERLGRRESAKMSSWIPAKSRHKKFVQQLLRVPAHVILCLRAEDKIEIVKDAETGKTVVRPKTTLVGAQGWVPITEKRLPFEATLSLLLLQDNPGVPVPIKLERRHQALVSVDEQLSEEVGVRLREWAAGGAANGSATITVDERKELFSSAKEQGIGQGALKEIVYEVTGRSSTATLTKDELAAVRARVAESVAAASDSADEAGAGSIAAEPAHQPELS